MRALDPSVNGNKKEKNTVQNYCEDQKYHMPSKELRVGTH